MKEEQRDDTPTEVMDAEREVARTKQQFQHSLQLVGETGSRLATEMRRKVTPTLLVAVVVGGAVVVGAAFMVARREPRRRWREPSQRSSTGTLARAVGGWLLRAAALHLAQALAARFLDSSPPALARHSDAQ